MSQIEKSIIESVIKILAEKENITVNEQAKMLSILRKQGDN